LADLLRSTAKERRKACSMIVHNLDNFVATLSNLIALLFDQHVFTISLRGVTHVSNDCVAFGFQFRNSFLEFFDFFALSQNRAVLLPCTQVVCTKP
jgi:hypothetical protein